jgi:hypothetical protein
MPLYGNVGVRNAWLVDPVERTLEVYRLVDAHWSLLATFSDEERVRAEPFDAIELDLGLLWADVELAELKCPFRPIRSVLRKSRDQTASDCGIAAS